MSDTKTVAIGAGLTLGAIATLALIARRTKPSRAVAGALRGGSPEAYELRLHIDNEAAIYKYKQAMRGAITKKVCAGKFDALKATKGFRAIVDAAAKDYAAQHDRGREAARTLFPGKIRDEVAAGLTDELKREINRCLSKADCADAPPELAKCAATTKPLAGARRRSSKGLRGPIDHATPRDFDNWYTKAQKMTDASLIWSRGDAIKAARAMASHNPEREGRYMDEAAIYEDELRRRRKSLSGTARRVRR